MNSGAIIVISAVVVAGVYIWRWFAKPSTAKASINPQSLVGLGSLVSPEGFILAWGITYLGVSILAAFSAPLGSAFAIAIVVGDLLGNGLAVAGATAQLEHSKLVPKPATTQTKG